MIAPFQLLVLLRFRWHTLRWFAFARFRYRRVCHLGQRRTIRGRSKDAAGRMFEFRHRICICVATWPSASTPSASRVRFRVSFLAKRKRKLEYNYFKILTKIQNINLSRSPWVIVIAMTDFVVSSKSDSLSSDEWYRQSASTLSKDRY